jgi:hypothetical protein
MRNQVIKWGRTLVLVVLLVGGLLFVSYAIGVIPAAAGKEREKDDNGNAYGIILKKLDHILDAIMIPPPINLFGVTQNWDRRITGPARFKVLVPFNSEAVRDNETGLVWEKVPDTTGYVWNTNEAAMACANKAVGGRKGWRLPAVDELASLLDSSIASPGPTLPAGHPFTAQSSDYWSATDSAVFPTPAGGAWNVDFRNVHVTAIEKSKSALVWCVRGNGPLNAY